MTTVAAVPAPREALLGPNSQRLEVGLLGAGERDRLLAVARLGADLVPGALEHVAQVEADDRLVLGDEDAKTRRRIDRHGFVTLACHPRAAARVRLKP